MSICPKCGKEPEDRNNSREYLRESRRGKVTTEKLCDFCN
jgi:hypothetical protein